MHSFTASHALPFCHLQINALRCLYPHLWKCTQATPANPKTLGEHLRRHRLQLHLMQGDLARRLGVHIETLKNWERGAGTPTIHQIPKILEFLGYDPEPEPEHLPRRIPYARRQLGLTQKQLAKALGVNAVTIWRWVTGRSVPPEAKLEGIQRLLTSRPGTAITRR